MMQNIADISSSQAFVYIWETFGMELSLFALTCLGFVVFKIDVMKSMVGKLSGLHLWRYLLAFGVALELVFWASGVQMQFGELWIVALLVPLALTLTKSGDETAQKRLAKKLVDDSGPGRATANRKRAMPTPGTMEGRSLQGQRGSAEMALSNERAAQKAKIDKCVKEGRVDQAEALLSTLVEKSNADAVSYNMVISACAKIGDGDKARSWMQQMLEKGVKPDIASFNSTIDSCARSGDTKGAEKWLACMKDAGVQPNTITYNALINTCARSGNIEMAKKWMAQMQADGVAPDVISYSAMINACTKKGDVSGAEAWLKSLIQSEVAPNVISYSTVISAFAKRGDKAGAEKWLTKMVESGIDADNICYNSVIDACAKAHDADGASLWMTRMLDSGVEATTVTYNALINACAKAQNVKQAERWLSTMIEKGVVADVVSYSTVINACAKVGNSTSAEGWLTKMLEAGVQANVQSYSAVVSAFAKGADAKGAEKWLLQMLESGIRGDTISYTAMINACARVGDVQKAEHWLEKMLEDGIEPNVITFNAVIAACANKAQSSKAPKAPGLKECAPDQDTTALQQSVDAITKASSGRRAQEWLDKMKRAGVSPNSFSYNSVAKPFVALGDYRKVEQIMADLRNHGLAFDDFCLTSLLYAYGNAKPKQQKKAEAAFRDYVAEYPQGLSSNALAALGRVIGRSAADNLCEECGIDRWAIEKSGGSASASSRRGGGGATAASRFHAARRVEW